MTSTGFTMHYLLSNKNQIKELLVHSNQTNIKATRRRQYGDKDHIQALLKSPNFVNYPVPRAQGVIRYQIT